VNEGICVSMPNVPNQRAKKSLFYMADENKKIKIKN
jgi:hypothetical protein